MPKSEPGKPVDLQIQYRSDAELTLELLMKFIEAYKMWVDLRDRINKERKDGILHSLSDITSKKYAEIKMLSTSPNAWDVDRADNTLSSMTIQVEKMREIIKDIPQLIDYDCKDDRLVLFMFKDKAFPSLTFKDFMDYVLEATKDLASVWSMHSDPYHSNNKGRLNHFEGLRQPYPETGTLHTKLNDLVARCGSVQLELPSRSIAYHAVFCELSNMIKEIDSQVQGVDNPWSEGKVAMKPPQSQ